MSDIHHTHSLSSHFTLELDQKLTKDEWMNTRFGGKLEQFVMEMPKI